MGSDCATITVRLDYVGNGFHVDDGIDGVYPVIGEVVLARQ